MKLISLMHNFLQVMECKTHKLQNDHFTIQQMGDEVFDLQKTLTKTSKKMNIEVFKAQEKFNDHLFNYGSI